MLTTSYKLLLFGHLLAVVALVGSSIGSHVLALRARAAGPARTAAFLDDVEWLGRRLQAPAALLVVVFGVWLGASQGFRFADAWLVLGLVGFAVCFVLVAGYLGPATARVRQLIAQRGADDPAVPTGLRQVLAVSRIELAVLVAIMLDMVVKPGA